MRYFFFGTPEFASIILKRLIGAGFVPAGVICNPDRPVGRKKTITSPPTKIVAQKHGIPVFQPEKLSDLSIGDADFAIVAAYSKIIPKEIIELFKLGVIGVHPSLLPKYRGATPIQSVILAGDEETGVTLYLMDEKVDHGKIILNSELRILNNDTYTTLEEKLADLAGAMLIETIPKFIEGKIKSEAQNETKATYTKKFTADDAYVDLEKDNPIIIERKIRALNPEPGVWTIWKGGKPIDAASLDLARDRQGKRVKLLEAELIEGKLRLKMIQIEGEKSKRV